MNYLRQGVTSSAKRGLAWADLVFRLKQFCRILNIVFDFRCKKITTLILILIYSIDIKLKVLNKNDILFAIPIPLSIMEGTVIESTSGLSTKTGYLYL
jgi:hypothetical protein